MKMGRNALVPVFPPLDVTPGYSCFAVLFTVDGHHLNWRRSFVRFSTIFSGSGRFLLLKPINRSVTYCFATYLSISFARILGKSVGVFVSFSQRTNLLFVCHNELFFSFFRLATLEQLLYFEIIT